MPPATEATRKHTMGCAPPIGADASELPASVPHAQPTQRPHSQGAHPKRRGPRHGDRRFGHSWRRNPPQERQRQEATTSSASDPGMAAATGAGALRQRVGDAGGSKRRRPHCSPWPATATLTRKVCMDRLARRALSTSDERAQGNAFTKPYSAVCVWRWVWQNSKLCVAMPGVQSDLHRSAWDRPHMVCTWDGRESCLQWDHAQYSDRDTEQQVATSEKRRRARHTFNHLLRPRRFASKPTKEAVHPANRIDAGFEG